MVGTGFSFFANLYGFPETLFYNNAVQNAFDICMISSTVHKFDPTLSNIIFFLVGEEKKKQILLYRYYSLIGS